MDFKEKYSYLRCDALRVEINDLSNYQTLRRKLSLTDEDMKLKFDKETLIKKKIIVPIMKNQPILPLQLHAKFSSFEFVNHGGGVIEIIQHIGKEMLNQRDKRYRTPVPQPDGRRKGPNRFYFYYDHDEKRYINIKDEEKWKEKLEWINGVKESEDVQEVIWNFFDFYEDYFLSGEYNKDKYDTGEIDPEEKRRIMGPITYQHYFDIVIQLEENISVLENYLYLSFIFGDIDKLAYDLGIKHIQQLNDVVSLTKNRILQAFGERMDDDYSSLADLLGVGNLRTSRSDFKEAIEKVFRPAVFYHTEKNILIPNLGQIYNRLQPSEKFESENSIFEKHDQQIESIKKASSISGRINETPIYL